MEARSYTLAELESHLQRSFDETSPLIPVTPLRLASYLHNPRAEPSDHVLFEMREGDQLVAYRTLLPDHFYGEEGIIHRFAWLSGNYVMPAYRRKGISTRLLQMAVERWEGRLMYTNYAPSSKAVYDRTGQFRVLADRAGERFYLRAASTELLKGRKAPHLLLPMADRLLNRLVDSKLKKFIPDITDDTRIYRIQNDHKGLEELTALPDRGSLFGRDRDRDIFRWILCYPWITTDPGDPLPYYFSYTSGHFENLLYRFDSDGKVGNGGEGVSGRKNKRGWIWLLVHGNRMAAPYLQLSDPGLLPAMAQILIDTMIRHGCAYITVRHDGLREALRNQRKWFLTVRQMPQLVFYHENLEGLFPEEFTLQDGDGDVVFTG